MNAVDAAIYSALTGDTTVGNKVDDRIYHGLAPEQKTYPFIVFQEVSGLDDYTMTRRATRTLRYQVMCVDKGPSAKAAGEVMDAVDGALHDQALTVASHDTLYVRRDSSREFTEVDAGIVYWHEVAEYLVVITPTT